MKFSIIVPCYNLEHWIRASLDSVLGQSCSDWECIVVDDESKDGSPAILDEYAAKDSRIKVIHQKNAGEGGARNSGLAVAQGEWIFFLDGDDVMAPNSLELLARMISQYPTERLIRFAYANFKDGDVFPVVEHSGVVLGPIDISRQIAYEDYYVYVWQFLFHRSVINGLQFKKYKRGADRTFIVPVLCDRVNSFVATDDVCYLYRQRQGSAMNTIPSVSVLCDEMDHRLDVAETMDKCGKEVRYCGTNWIEKYFTHEIPRIMISRPNDFVCLSALWHERLLRAMKLKGFSPKAQKFFRVHSGGRFMDLLDP